MKIPKLVLTSANTWSTTYSFVTEGEGYKSWALCTVNDQTGELLITSDYGSWSHRWHASPEAFGAPTLTAFIGTRGDVDYLARKLQPRSQDRTRFSAEGTARELHRLLCARRLEDGREQLECRLEPDDYDGGRLPNHLMGRYTEAGLPLISYREVDAPTWQDPTRKERLPYLTTEAARTLWDEIDGTIGECSPSTDLMFDRLLRLSGFVEYVTDEPWNHVVTEQTPEDKALRDIVLPALIRACKDTISQREDTNPCPDGYELIPGFEGLACYRKKLETQVEEPVSRDRHGQGLPCAFCDGRTANVEYRAADERHAIVNGVAVCQRCLGVVERVIGSTPVDDVARIEALHAFVAGYVTSRPADGPLGHEAEDNFNRWWNDPSVAKARAERRGKQTSS